MIIGIAGFKGSGKGAISDILVKEGFKKVSFADKVKDACSTIFEWDRVLLEGETKESRKWREEVDEWWSERLGIKDFCPRLALQWLGTEAGRKVFGEEIWAAALEKKILENPGNYVIPDTRFPNEIHLVHSLRGVNIRVRRGPEPDWYNDALEWNQLKKLNPKNHAILPGKLKNIHESERAWIGEKFTYTIENNGTLEELEKKVKSLLLNRQSSNRQGLTTNLSNN